MSGPKIIFQKVPYTLPPYTTPGLEDVSCMNSKAIYRNSKNFHIHLMTLQRPNHTQKMHNSKNNIMSRRSTPSIPTYSTMIQAALQVPMLIKLQHSHNPLQLLLSTIQIHGSKQRFNHRSHHPIRHHVRARTQNDAIMQTAAPP